jgi:hypothetical protein
VESLAATEAPAEGQVQDVCRSKADDTQREAGYTGSLFEGIYRFEGEASQNVCFHMLGSSNWP